MLQHGEKMTLKILNTQLTDALAECTFIDNPLTEARLILTELLGKTTSEFLSMPPETYITREIEKSAFSAVNSRKEGRSIASILGFKDFYDLRFKVNDDVLIPRPETEFLIEYVLNLKKNDAKLKVLDVGAGSGTICVTIAKHRPHWDIDALEISSKAVDILKQNIDSAHVAVNILNHDFFEFKAAHNYNLILSNPPYIPTEDAAVLLRHHNADDPIIALDGGSDGLIFYRELRKFAQEYLDKDGLLIMEHGFDQKKAMHEIFGAVPFIVVETLQDYAGLDRITAVRKVN